MTLRNDRRLGVRNGETAIVTGVDAESRGLTVRTDHDTTVTLPAGYLDLGHLVHAYATTIHKAQGLTTERALVLGTDDLYQESGYVAMSRGRATNTIYVVDPEPDPEVHGRGPEPQDPVDRLSHHLDVSRAQRLAIETLNAQSLTSSLAELYKERAGVSEQDREGRAYAESLDRLIAGQLNGLVEARTFDPPAYLHNELGAIPDSKSAQARWRHGARAIEAYRCANAISDPTRALGAEPPDPESLSDWQDARRHVNDAARTVRTLQRIKRLQIPAPSPSLDPSPTRTPSPELGLDL